MAGFKQTLKEHRPVSLITFDGDQFDPILRTSLANPPVILDESQYQNNAIIMNEQPDFPGYRMGMSSLVGLEQTDQYAMAFGYNGYNALNPSGWTKTLLQVPHNAALGFPQNNGSFTLSFIYYRDQDENAGWRETRRLNGQSYTDTLQRPIMRKAGVFDIWWEDYWSSQHVVALTGPDNKRINIRNDTLDGASQASSASRFYKRNLLFTCVYDCALTSPGVYTCNWIIYINGRERARTTWTALDTPPVVNAVSPVEIGGRINSAAVHNDRNTSFVMLDQIGIFNKAFTPNEVAWTWKKMLAYDDMIHASYPVNFWTMGDADSNTSFAMVDSTRSTSNRPGVYIGGNQLAIRGRAGPPRLGGSAVTFVNGGMAAVHATSGGYQTIFDPSGDYTVEMWVNFSSPNRGVIFSNQRDDMPFPGMLLECNRRNNQDYPGGLQFSVNSTVSVSSLQYTPENAPYHFGDGQFHHVVLIRRGTNIELWIDSIRHAVADTPIARVSSPGPGQLYMMSMMPGQLFVNGTMSYLITYDYALQAQEIRARYSYRYLYRIQGNVTLQGTPHRADIRVMNTLTGDLIAKTVSDQSTGAYSINLYDNTLLDLYALNIQDPNVRYRIYGPIRPAELEDPAQ
ncbi:hypothetical protein CPT_Marzo_230 [Stenotrophomonas phage Marzo]|nr:hypothetical protein CPT_Marzo_230 [Stenotrophomonas phage Marzo]